ncbi:uncharacterized protein LOC134191089 [Corticium candelabrum]|uniref:uncharacterized protein LOC134191089 n=1 Tax=Corticium candelabrum TaxID=121492 RepID=UPI002E26E4CF|nr:uncharacterized protein LOC134191089 [Corticium candelabrum]
MEDLDERLARHSAYFNSILSLIPAKDYYLPLKENENKYWKNKNQKAPKQEIKDASKKAKRLRLNPEAQKSVLELQVELDAQRESDDSEIEKDNSAKRPRLRVDCEESRSVAELRLRLREKIEEARAKRKAPASNDTASQQRKKTKRDEKKGKKKSKSKVGRQTTTISQKPRQEIVNDDGEVVFSKFDFTTGVTDGTHDASSSRKMNKDFRKLIEKAEKRRTKLNELKMENPDKAEAKAEKIAWKTATEKAEGIKQTDDISLLKKAAKRRQKQKDRSSRDWKKRIGSQKEKQIERQEKRQRHIQERIEQKKARKMGLKLKLKKKQRKPGF